jgi:hypothetical protein
MAKTGFILHKQAGNECLQSLANTAIYYIGTSPNSGNGTLLDTGFEQSLLSSLFNIDYE